MRCGVFYFHYIDLIFFNRMVPQNLTNLIHEPQFRIWFEFGLFFHDIKK